MLLGASGSGKSTLLNGGGGRAAQRALGDGFRVTTRVITTSVDQALLVPVGALFPHDKGFAAPAGGIARRLQLVEPGGRNGATAWVRQGLQAGQAVILYPPAQVADGKRLRVRTP